MVVVGIFRSEESEERAIRLVGPDSNKLYEEKIGQNETLLSMRTSDLEEAQRIGSLLERAGAQDVEIDAEAA